MLFFLLHRVVFLHLYILNCVKFHKNRNRQQFRQWSECQNIRILCLHTEILGKTTHRFISSRTEESSTKLLDLGSVTLKNFINNKTNVLVYSIFFQNV
jgi:hypothetical protein